EQRVGIPGDFLRGELDGTDAARMAAPEQIYLCFEPVGAAASPQRIDDPGGVPVREARTLLRERKPQMMLAAMSPARRQLAPDVIEDVLDHRKESLAPFQRRC